MLKKPICATVALLMIYLLLPYSVFAADRLTYHHGIETDTMDYCISVNDVGIGLSELQANADEKAVKSLIIETANPEILVRNSGATMENWRQLANEELSFDFSQFLSEPREQGYPVIVTAPPISMETPSSISFYVYVIDDLPKPLIATIQFATTELPNLEIDITNRGSVKYKNLTVPTKNSFSFLGWYLDEAFTRPFLLPDSEEYAQQEITGDMILYPKWEQNSVYATVQFATTKIPNLQINITNGAILNYSQLTVPLKDGFNFLGWYLDEAYTQPFLLPSNKEYGERSVSGDIILYPKWEQNSIYATVQFATTKIPNLQINITNGAILNYSQLTVPLKDGFNFLGWYLDEAYTQPFLLPSNKEYGERSVSGDIILYPKWEQNSIYATVQFATTKIPNLQINITNGATLSYSQLTVPVKDGFIFSGWYLDEACTQPFLLPNNEEYAEQTVSKDLILCPKWVKVVLPPQIPSLEKPIIPPTEQPPVIEQPAEPPLPPVLTKLPLIIIQPKSDEQQPESENKEETNEQEQNNDDEQEISPPKVSTPAEEGGISLVEIILLFTGSTAVLSLAGSVASDIRVLNRHEAKKRARLMQ